MTAQQLYTRLETAIKHGCGDYDILFMDVGKFPHAVNAVLLDHASKTLDLLPYPDGNE